MFHRTHSELHGTFEKGILGELCFVIHTRNIKQNPPDTTLALQVYLVAPTADCRTLRTWKTMTSLPSQPCILDELSGSKSKT